MKRKIRVGILFGGRSAEHEVSLQSAKNVAAALDKTKYEALLIGIDKRGQWHLQESARVLLETENPRLLKLTRSSENVAVVPGRSEQQLVPVKGQANPPAIDVIFPVLHGPFGEDGTVQGLLKLMDVPFVGAGVLGSALGMDKDAMKRLLNAAKIPTAKFAVFHHHEAINFEKVRRELKLPLFVKPANLGSSVGVRKVRNKREFEEAVTDAFQYDKKILVEGAVKGREIECSVLGNEDPIASIPGEIIPRHEFYSYEAKYIDPEGAALEIPAKLPPRVTMRVQELAVRAFKTLCLEGMARVDFFVTRSGRVLVNEANTIPGFTNISMYPKLWEASGIPQRELIDRLIRLAIERHMREKRLKTSYGGV